MFSLMLQFRLFGTKISIMIHSHFQIIWFIVPLLLTGNGSIHIEHQSHLIGVIDAHHIKAGSNALPNLFKQIRAILRTRTALIMSRHFNLLYNGEVITRSSLNLIALSNSQSKQDVRIQVVYPHYVSVHRDPYFTFHQIDQNQQITSFIVGNQFEMEFDFRILADPKIASLVQRRVHLLFLGNDRSSLQVWIDPDKTARALRIMHFNSESTHRDTRGWTELLCMDLPDGSNGTNHTYIQYNHFYIRIGDRATSNVIRANVNGHIAVKEPPFQIFRKGETTPDTITYCNQRNTARVTVSLFKAAHAVTGVVRNLVFYHN